MGETSKVFDNVGPSVERDIELVDIDPTSESTFSLNILGTKEKDVEEKRVIENLDNENSDIKLADIDPTSERTVSLNILGTKKNDLEERIEIKNSENENADIEHVDIDPTLEKTDSFNILGTNKTVGEESRVIKSAENGTAEEPSVWDEAPTSNLSNEEFLYEDQNKVYNILPNSSKVITCSSGSTLPTCHKLKAISELNEKEICGKQVSYVQKSLNSDQGGIEISDSSQFKTCLETQTMGSEICRESCLPDDSNLKDGKLLTNNKNNAASDIQNKKLTSKGKSMKMRSAISNMLERKENEMTYSGWKALKKRNATLESQISKEDVSEPSRISKEVVSE